MKNKKIVILPKGIKDMSDVMDSKEFKDFLNSAIEPNPKPEPPLYLSSLSENSIIVGGVGRSYISEYLESLPEVTMDDIRVGKCDGHLIAMLDC